MAGATYMGGGGAVNTTPELLHCGPVSGGGGHVIASRLVALMCPSVRHFGMIGALRRHPATSCQQHRLSVRPSVLSRASAPRTYTAENKLSVQEST